MQVWKVSWGDEFELPYSKFFVSKAIAEEFADMLQIRRDVYVRVVMVEVHNKVGTPSN